jgi:hypothetical protein
MDEEKTKIDLIRSFAEAPKKESEITCVLCGRFVYHDARYYWGEGGAECSWCVFPLGDSKWPDRPERLGKLGLVEVQRRPSFGEIAVGAIEALGKKAEDTLATFMAMQARVQYLEGENAAIKRENERLNELLNKVAMK